MNWKKLLRERRPMTGLPIVKSLFNCLISKNTSYFTCDCHTQIFTKVVHPHNLLLVMHPSRLEDSNYSEIKMYHMLIIFSPTSAPKWRPWQFWKRLSYNVWWRHSQTGLQVLSYTILSQTLRRTRLQLMVNWSGYLPLNWGGGTKQTQLSSRRPLRLCQILCELVQTS